MELFSAPSLLIAFGTILIYCISVAVYRLYLGPLANFPGPKLAAVTLWYEFYYDAIKCGKYTWEIAKMHQEYGMKSMLVHSRFLDD